MSYPKKTESPYQATQLTWRGSHGHHGRDDVLLQDEEKEQPPARRWQTSL